MAIGPCAVEAYKLKHLKQCYLSWFHVVSKGSLVATAHGHADIPVRLLLCSVCSLLVGLTSPATTSELLMVTV